MTLAQLLRLAAKLISRLRSDRLILVNLDKDSYAALQTLARQQNITIEELMRQAVSEFLKSHTPPK